MIVEVIAVGTELLVGSRVNTNSARIAERLAAEGMDCHYQVVVGDNLDRVAAALGTALERADAVVLTGGIGPTHDDLTREAICHATGRAMDRDQGHAEWISERIRAQGREPSPNQLRMADLPEGAEPIANEAGTALGIAIEHSGKLIFALPGVPGEMLPMLESGVLPRLRSLAGGPSILRTRVIKVWGLGESTVSSRIEDLADGANPSIALLIRDMEVEVRITAKAGDREAAEALISPVEADVVNRLGEAVFAYDDDTVEDQVSALLADRGWVVSTREEATLGAVGARLASTAGGSFRGTLIPGSGGAPAKAPDADVVVSVGPIGPDAQARRLARPVSIEVTTPNGSIHEVFQFGGNDERVRAFATVAALHLVRLALVRTES